MELIILIYLKSLKYFEYFLPKNIHTFLFIDQQSYYKIYTVLKPFFFQEMLKSVVLQSCFPSCSPGSCLWPLASVGLPAVPVGVIAVGSHRMNGQTNKIPMLGITWWQAAVQGTGWKQYLLWANVSPGSA